jgi:cytochrome c oxidase cbb3-type subunit III
MANVERDPITGQDTTGHEWDGIKELNTPMPKWWLYTMYACFVFAAGYWVLYPAWPGISGYSKGVLGYSSRAALDQDLVAQKQSRSVWSNQFATMSIEEIGQDQQLMNYAMAGGRSIFAENCAGCHGTAGSGAPGYPVLVDDDWIWGGTKEDIYTTIKYGIRSGHDDARVNEMPNFMADEILNKKQIGDVAQYVLSLSGHSGDAAAVGRGAPLFAEQCVACHGEDGKGMKDLGAPNLTDSISFYGDTRDTIAAQISKPRHGVMPAWVDRLDDVTIKQVSLYVHSLGGGM